MGRSMAEKKIVIVNAHWSNRGDEAALRAILNRLIEKYDKCRFTIIFKDSQEVQQFPYEGNVAHFSSKFLPKNIVEVLMAVQSKGRGRLIRNEELKRSVRELQTADFIVYSPGGSVISDRFWWKKQLEYLVPFVCAKVYKIPMALAAPSIGPFEDKKIKNIIRKKLLNTPECVCIREKISTEYLGNIGVTKNVITTIDSAFYDNVDVEKNKETLAKYQSLGNYLSKFPKTVAITVTDFSWHVKYAKDEELRTRIEKTMQSFIHKMEKEGVGVIMIPQLFGNQDDKEYLDRFRSDNIFVLSDDMDTYFQQYLISKIYGVVGMRYHSNIFAAKMGTPFIAIAYEEKMSGFMEMENLNEYMIKLEDLSMDNLVSTWDKLEKNYEQYKEILIQSHSRWQKKAENTLSQIEKVADLYL